MHTLLDKHWHHLPADEALDLLGSNLESGLDVFEVKHRQQHFGPNVPTPKRGKGPLVRFLLQFDNPLLYILLMAGAITAVLKDAWTLPTNLGEGLVILAAILAGVALPILPAQILWISLGAHTGGRLDYLRNRRDREMGAPPADNRAANRLVGNDLMVCDVI
jgi:magnesium-transporting ATPase (P-type)